jgi:hypothetical protein
MMERKGLERSSVEGIKVLPWHFYRETEESHEKPLSV